MEDSLLFGASTNMVSAANLFISAQKNQHNMEKTFSKMVYYCSENRRRKKNTQVTI